jgi:hypothetical protein
MTIIAAPERFTFTSFDITRSQQLRDLLWSFSPIRYYFVGSGALNLFFAYLGIRALSFCNVVVHHHSVCYQVPHYAQQ